MIVMALAERYPLNIDPHHFPQLTYTTLNPQQIKAVESLNGQTFQYKWQLKETLAKISPAWQQPSPKLANQLAILKIEGKSLTLRILCLLLKSRLLYDLT